MKSIWDGAISFGLVSIPIKLHSVAKQHAIGFKMLCSKCNNPISLKRWCNHCKKEIEWSRIVKGLEIKKGEYFVITKEALKALKPTKSTTIDIFAFADNDLIDPVYYNTHYYVAPTEAHKAYTLFHYALGSSNKVAIGSFVMRDREHLCIIQSYYVGLLLTTLYYHYEVRPVSQIPELQGKQPTVSSNELKLAKQLIGQLTIDSFDIREYKDTFAQELKKVITHKKKGKMITLEKIKKIKPTKNIHPSLINELKASLKKEKLYTRIAKSTRAKSKNRKNF